MEASSAVERLRAEQLASAPEALAFLLHCFMEELRGPATARETTPTVQTAEFAGEVTLQVVAVGESALAVHVLRPSGPPIHWAVEVGAFAGVRSEVGAEVEATVGGLHAAFADSIARPLGAAAPAAAAEPPAVAPAAAAGLREPLPGPRSTLLEERHPAPGMGLPLPPGHMPGAGLLGSGAAQPGPGGLGGGMLVGPGHPLFGVDPLQGGGPGGVGPARFDPIHPLPGPDDPHGGGVGGPPGGPDNDELPPPSGLDEDDIDSMFG